MKHAARRLRSWLIYDVSQKMNLTLIILVVGLFLVMAIALAVLKTKGGASESAKPDVYQLKKSLFSPAERSFVGVLESLDYDGVTIAFKVRLADIFDIKKGLERGVRQGAFNRISAKHVDFLLIQSTDGRPLLGVELDDSSHQKEERVARDSLVDSVFASAGLPILHVPAKAAYDPKEVHRQIDAAIGQRANKAPEPTPRAVTPRATEGSSK